MKNKKVKELELNIISPHLEKQLLAIGIKGETTEQIIQRLMDIYHYPEEPTNSFLPTPLHYRDHLTFHRLQRSKTESNKIWNRKIERIQKEIQEYNKKLHIDQFREVKK